MEIYVSKYKSLYWCLNFVDEPLMSCIFVTVIFSLDSWTLNKISKASALGLQTSKDICNAIDLGVKR